MKMEAVDTNYSLIGPCPHHKTSTLFGTEEKRWGTQELKAGPTTDLRATNINTEGSVSLALEGGKGNIRSLCDIQCSYS